MKHSKLKILITRIIFAALLCSSLATIAPSQTPASTPIPLASPPESSAQLRQATFELVWQTVNKNFYDPNFNGVNWKAVHDRYAPRVAATTSDAELYGLLQLMVNELHQSHLWIIPPQAIPKVRPKQRTKTVADDAATEEASDEPDEESPLDLMKERLADKMSTGIGVDVRVVNRSIVITRVAPGSAAARAGLRPGYLIKSVNGKTSVAALADLENNQVFRDIIRPLIPMALVATFINGNGSDAVDLTYIDARNLVRHAHLAPEKLSGEMSEAIGNLPPLYAEFEAKRLGGNVGYIRFNAFVPAMMRKACAALREMHDAPGLILDLRGNEGGLLGMISGLGGLLQSYASVFGTMKMRSAQTPVVVAPQRKPYVGPLVILIDGSTQSAAEMFTAAMQTSGRALVVGEVSAGSTLPSAIIKLPTGGLFQYAFGNYETNEGIRLEGRGVIPDSIVKLTRPTLLRSGDPQLAQAMVKLREKISWESPKELVADVTAAPPATADNTRVEISEPPPAPPAKASSAPPKVEETTKSDQENARLAKQIVNRFIQTIGGEAALAQVKTRVATGTVELPMDLNGTVEVYEAAPNRSSIIMNLKGFGTVRTIFDRTASWVQDPVRGYIQLWAGESNEDTFHRELALLRQINSLRFESKEKVGGEDCSVVVETVSGRVIQRLYFSDVTGLLVRQNNLYLEDYREVDGVKLPFVSRQETMVGGLSTVVRLTEVKQNIPIDESKFAERSDCFTNPDQKWRAQN
jgi:carboxyl-terminal processing protease